MKNLLQTISTRHRVPLPSSDTSPTDFDLIAALLTPSASASTTVSDEEDDEDERRTATLLLLRLAYAQAHAQLASIAQELELLLSAPPAPTLHQPGISDHARSSREAEHTLWTLDAPRSISSAQRGGPLMDSAGKVCGHCSALLWAFLLMRMYICSRCSHSQYYLLAREGTSVRGCGNKCSSLITASPR
jgi:immunoglobulin-binding protein 1